MRLGIRVLGFEEEVGDMVGSPGRFWEEEIDGKEPLGYIIELGA